jgi:hypothetical protein
LRGAHPLILPRIRAALAEDPMTRTTLAIPASLALALLGGALHAEPKLSPSAETVASIGGKRIEVRYSAPSARGRKIFGDVVPYGKVWRTGANAATTLTTEGDLEFKGLALPKGQYSLYSVAREGGLTLVINKQTGQWGTRHDAAQDLGRVEMEVQKPPVPVETMIITLAPAGEGKGTLTIAWGEVTASAPFTVR